MSLDMCVGAHTGGVVLEGDITPTCGLELAGLVRTLRDDGFYQRVVLQITSPGGAINAVSDFAEAQRSFGVTVVTHVPSNAGSAAAVLASLGDERLASEGATLQYHTARLPHVEGVTAFAAHSLGESLLDGDAKMVRTLADRGRAAPSPARARLGQFRPSDWQVIAHLLDDSAPRRNRRRLLTRLRAAVADAVAADRPHALRALYARLLLLDTPISAALAVELRLLDRVGEPDIATASQPDDGPCVTIPEWSALYRDGRVPRAALCRHTLILGETGSGKTASGIMPVVRALLDERSPVGVALVIDPKDEIAAAIDGQSTAVREIDLDRDTLNLAAGRHSVQPHLEAGDVITAANELLCRVTSLDRGNAARTLAGHAAAGRDPYWEREGARLGETVLAFVLFLYSHASRLFGTIDEPGALAGMADVTAWSHLLGVGERAGLVRRCDEIGWIADEYRRGGRESGPSGDWEGDDGEETGGLEDKAAVTRAQQELTEFFERVSRSDLHERSPGFRADIARLRRAPFSTVTRSTIDKSRRSASTAVRLAATRCLDHPPQGSAPSALAVAADALKSLFNQTFQADRVVRHLDGREGFGSGEVPKLFSAITDYWRPMTVAEGQFAGVMGTSSTVFSCFADSVPAKVFRFGCEPGEATLDFRGDVERGPGEGRTIHVFRCGLSREDALVARAIKASFFGAVLDSPSRAGRGGADRPLAAYVADEFHRFVTDDASHGEQSFLDTCRSFGGCCVLATQSVSSVRHALSEAGAPPGDAVNMLLANTSTKLFFRSTEAGVRELLEGLSPASATRVPITSVRPPSTLQPGECYALLADGRFERRQLQPYTAKRAPQRAAKRSRRRPAPARAMR